MSLKRLVAIEKAIDKTLAAVVLKRSKEYLKPFKDKVWHDTAVKYLSSFEIVLAEILQTQQKEYVKLFESAKRIYVNQPIKKDKKYKTYEYLDERHNKVVVPDIVDSLEVISAKYKKILKDSYDKYITNGLIRDSAELVYKDLGMSANFNKFDEATRDYLRDKSIKWAKQVTEDTEKKVKEVMAQGFEEGLGSYELAERMRRQNKEFSYSRCEAIARTETMAACNYSDYIAYMQNDSVVALKWRTTMDERRRPTHAAANGQIRVKGVPFDVGGYKLMYPLDSSLGAPAKEIVQCRCGLNPIYKGSETGSNTVYDQEGYGTDEWLSKQSKEFKESYLGGKTKQTLFDSGTIGIGDKETSTKDVVKGLLSNTVENIIKIKGINPSNALANDYYSKLIPLVLEVQLKGIRQDKEFARVIDYSTGEAIKEGVLKGIIAGSDDKREVAFTKEQLDEINKNENSYIVIHNHPESISFSFGDLVLFYKNKGIKSMIVVGSDGSVYFLSGKGRIIGLPTEKDGIERFIKEMHGKIKDEITNKYKSRTGTLQKDIVDADVKKEYNKIMKRMISERGFLYSFEEVF